MNDTHLEPEIYFGQFGTYQITDRDRWEVRIYRAGLLVAALCFAGGSGLILQYGNIPWVINALTPLYLAFCLALGVSLLTIHIYMASLHRLLQAFWLVGFASAVDLLLQGSEPLALALYHQPNTLWGVGFTFAALTGIFFKEAFCFDRFETKLLTPLVPLLLLGHLTGWLPEEGKPILLGVWAVLFFVFAARKIPQSIPSDIGDKSVFEHFRQSDRSPTSEA
ncbi:MAG: DUF2301 domain-containing membrane protein [Cyanobacteria bacterium SID2]|nr:DUF2301 domain-containing membrane protein [Cyanobacteria bacterium SID2]MBP0004136.1 DUF2301 domain-containing membrane protein [Cyanobacteria bacterium SBC]